MRELSVNRIDFQAPTLVGPLGQTQDLDPLAVQHLNNRLSIYYKCDDIQISFVSVFRSLKCDRLKVHKNFMASLMIR